MLPPTTLTAIPSRKEIDFRRLLARTEELMEACGDQILCITPKSAKLAANLRLLRHELETWQQELAHQSFDKQVMSAYQQSVQRLSRMIDDSKLTSPVDRVSVQSRAAAFAHPQEHVQSKETLQELRLRRCAENIMKEALFEDKQRQLTQPKSPALTTDADLRRELLSGTKDSLDVGNADLESILRRDQAIHDELTEDMVRLASVLKSNVTTFGDILKRDEQILSDTQATMMGSLDRLSREGQRLGAFRQKAGKTTAFIWSVLLFVVVVFVLTFMFIRLFPKL